MSEEKSMMNKRGKHHTSRSSGTEGCGGNQPALKSSVGDKLSSVRARLHLDGKDEGVIQNRCETIRNFADNGL